MPVERDVILAKINLAFGEAEVELIDTVGDKDHYDLRIKSGKFNGLNRIAQHKLVMDALGEMVGKNLHAISIKTITM